MLTLGMNVVQSWGKAQDIYLVNTNNFYLDIFSPTLICEIIEIVDYGLSQLSLKRRV